MVVSHLYAAKKDSVIARVHISHQNKHTQNKEIKSFFLKVFNFLYHKNKNGDKAIAHKKCSKKTTNIGDNV
jgi:hypothetical protein